MHGSQPRHETAVVHGCCCSMAPLRHRLTLSRCSEGLVVSRLAGDAVADEADADPSAGGCKGREKDGRAGACRAREDGGSVKDSDDHQS